MGNQQSDMNRVTIAEVGGADQPERGDVGRPDESQPTTTSDDPSGRRFNPYFLGAWVVSTAMVFVGGLSVWFSSEQLTPGMAMVINTEYFVGEESAVEPSGYHSLMSALISPVNTGSLLLIGGCLLAGLLLVLHAVNHQKRT